MTDSSNKPVYWGHVTGRMADGQNIDKALAEQYRRIHFDLITRWADVVNSKTILKTDLFAEALCPSRAFLWDILKINSNVIAIDVSAEITSRARKNTTQYTLSSSVEFLTGDIRRLPFADASFDLIVSDSTLDHFDDKQEIATSISELSRILKPGGTLIITMDNKGNITEPLFRFWIMLGLAPFFIGETYSIRELKKALAEKGFCVKDNTAIIHNPRLITKKAISLLRKIAPTIATVCINRLLNLLDRLENRRTKYLTSQFIAAKAVKNQD